MLQHLSERFHEFLTLEYYGNVEPHLRDQDLFFSIGTLFVRLRTVTCYFTLLM